MSSSKQSQHQSQNQSQRSIIAVGYDISKEAITNFVKEVKELLLKKSRSGKTLQEDHPLFNVDDFVISDIKSGVYYGRVSNMIDDDCIKKDSELQKWYEKNKNTSENTSKIIIDSLYYHYSTTKKGERNPMLILVAAHNVSGDRFFSVLSNMTNGNSTTQYKRNIRNGNYGSPIVFNPSIVIKADAYIYYY
jgi:hypothetical protein